MPVFAYEGDNTDAPPTYTNPTQPSGAYHVAEAIFEFPFGFFKVSLDADQQVMSLAPGGDSQAMSAAQIELDHNCGFWDKVSPRP